MTSQPDEHMTILHPEAQGWQLRAVLLSLILTLLLSALDQTIVGTALPRIIADLQGFDRYPWVLTAYLLASTTMVPIVGKLSDQFGRKWFLIAGVLIFLIGSALAGTSQTMNDLILFRGLQGLGAGIAQTLCFTVVADLFPPDERAQWQGIFTAIFGLASVIGPAAGGWITDHLGWRWVFFINLPLGAVALMALLIWLPRAQSLQETTTRGWAAVRRVDLLGALTAASATVCLLLGLSWGGQTYPWTSWQIIGSLSAACILFIVFFFVERGAREPILPLSLLRNQIFATSALLTLLIGMALLALTVYIPLFIQDVQGQSATNSGIVVTPLMVSLTVASILCGALVSRLHCYQWSVVLGAALLTLGAFLMTRVTFATSSLAITGNMIVLGLGVGATLPIVTVAVQNAIPQHLLGAGTGAISYLRQLGSTLGVALIGTVVNTTFADELAHHLPPTASHLPHTVLAAATSLQILQSATAQQSLKHRFVQGAVQQTVAQIPPGPQHDQMVTQVTARVTTQVTSLLDQIFSASRDALVIGIEHAFVGALAICGAILVVSFFLKDVSFKQQGQPLPLEVENGKRGGTK